MIIKALLVMTVIGGSAPTQAHQGECQHEATLVYSIAHMRDVGVPLTRVSEETNKQISDAAERKNLFEMAEQIYATSYPADQLKTAMFNVCMQRGSDAVTY